MAIKAAERSEALKLAPYEDEKRTVKLLVEGGTERPPGRRYFRVCSRMKSVACRNVAAKSCPTGNVLSADLPGPRRITRTSPAVPCSTGEVTEGAAVALGLA